MGATASLLGFILRFLGCSSTGAVVVMAALEAGALGVVSVSVVLMAACDNKIKKRFLINLHDHLW